jgi:hypothetical protein
MDVAYLQRNKTTQQEICPARVTDGVNVENKPLANSRALYDE